MDNELIRKVIMWGLVIIVLVAISFQACDRIYEKIGLEPDNIVEEAFEDVLEKETGVKIDITPESKEN